MQANDRHVGNDWAYSLGGSQYGAWNDTSPDKIRLKVIPADNMSRDTCIDAHLDWFTANTGAHYDGRFVRSCEPGRSAETDPLAQGGNGWWSESPTWEYVVVDGTQRGWGYTIDDDWDEVEDEFEHVDWEKFSGAAVDPGAGPPRAPITAVSGWARIRTRYESGLVDACNPLPARQSGFEGCF